MENHLIRKATVILSIVMVFICCIIMLLPYAHSDFVEIRDARIRYKQQKRANDQMTPLELLEYNTKKEAQKQSIQVSNLLKIPLPQGTTAKDIVIRNHYVQKKIEIEIPGMDQEFLLQHPVIGSSNWIVDMEMEENNKGMILFLSMDTVLETSMRDNGQYAYLSFHRAKEQYEKRIVIDAGHGGTDPGCVVGSTMEKDINVQIVNRLKNLFDQQDRVGVYYTRLEDPKPTYQQRVDLANDTESTFFISIHQNSVPKPSDNYIEGIEILYDTSANKSPDASKNFARTCMESVVESSGGKNRGIIERNDLFVLNHTNMASIIVETGYLTNKEERDKLKDVKYQEKIAQGLYDAIMKALEEN